MMCLTCNKRGKYDYRPLTKSRCREEDNIEVDFEEIYGYVDCIHLAHKLINGWLLALLYRIFGFHKGHEFLDSLGGWRYLAF